MYLIMKLLQTKTARSTQAYSVKDAEAQSNAATRGHSTSSKVEGVALQHKDTAPLGNNET
jgi:hypothetical protein